VSIRTIVFDFGNVIGYFSHRRAAEQLMRFAPPGLTAEQIIDCLYCGEVEARFETNETPSDRILELMREKLRLDGSDDALSQAYADMFTPNEHACRLVPQLQGAYRLMLLSNTNALHYAHFRRQFAGVLDRFDALIASHEVGYRKPDPRIFRHAQTLADAEPHECLFIDDVSANVEAAKACGWRGVVYDRDDDMRARLVEVGVRFTPDR
jgi:glucose-1-phosphatase